MFFAIQLIIKINPLVIVMMAQSDTSSFPR